MAGDEEMDHEEADTLARLKQRKAKPGVHYGSIEEAERLRILAKAVKKAEAGDSDEDDENVPSTVNVDGDEMATPFTKDEYMQLESAENDERKSLLEEFERRKLARQIHVSTVDSEVRLQLRAVGEPMTLFGEGPADRRNRLRDYLSRSGGLEALKKLKGMLAPLDSAAERQREDALDHKVTWYHEGPVALKDARVFLAHYSLPRARDRLAAAKEYQGLPETVKQSRKQEIQKKLRNYAIQASQIGDTRPVSFCSISPDSSMLATSSWRGLCKLWSMPSCEPISTLRGHECNACCIVFHPKSTIGQDASSINLASSATDGSVKLWSLDSDEPLAEVEGHPKRVSRVAFHPSGRFLATCVADNSWRLWDLETMTEILHQEGHSDAVYDICFQCDGAIAVTAGLDSFARAWDLRTGQCVMLLSGHIKAVLGVDMNPNGYHIATGSQDNSIKMWDLRRRQEIYAIPAHTNLVSKVKFHPGHGQYLISSSYDNTAKVWSHPLWQPLKTLSGHDNKVMGVDIAPNDQYVVTCSFDRTYKLWGIDDAF